MITREIEEREIEDRARERSKRERESKSEIEKSDMLIFSFSFLFAQILSQHLIFIRV